MKDSDTQINENIMGNLPVLEVRNRHASAVVSLQGAHVVDFCPKGHDKVLWLSSKAEYKEGKAIRGGVPICWPWFANRAEGGPNHGFARTNLWILETSEELDDGETCLLLSLPQTTHPEWDGEARLKVEIMIGSTLQISLITRNIGDNSISISQALHSYFTVSDTGKISVKGLDGTRFYDKVNDYETTRDGEVTIHGEVDRIYYDEKPACTIEDQGMNRRIVVEKSGSNATVIWNPGPELSAAIGDMADDSYQTMVCVETATAPNLPVIIQPGDSHVLTARIRVEARLAG